MKVLVAVLCLVSVAVANPPLLAPTLLSAPAVVAAPAPLLSRVHVQQPIVQQLAIPTPLLQYSVPQLVQAPIAYNTKSYSGPAPAILAAPAPVAAKSIETRTTVIQHPVPIPQVIAAPQPLIYSAPLPQKSIQAQPLIYSAPVPQKSILAQPLIYSAPVPQKSILAQPLIAPPPIVYSTKVAPLPVPGVKSGY